MNFRVEITRPAAREIDHQYREIAHRSRPMADRWVDGILRAIRTLDQLPQRFPLSPESEWYGNNLRELYYGKRRNTYRIMFKIEGNVVYVLRIRHGRQDYLNPSEL